MKKFKKILLIVLVSLIIILIALPFIVNKETKILNDEARKNTSGSFVTLPQGITHYEEVGSDTSETILLIHGFSVPYYIWDPTFEALKNEGYHVIRFDLFGRGYSDRPDVVYNKAFYMKQISDLLDALHVDGKIDIIGISMGGALTTDFANENPNRINKLIILDPVHNAVKESIVKVPYLGYYIANVLLSVNYKQLQVKSIYNEHSFPNWVEQYEEQMQYKGFNRALISSLRNYMSEDKIESYKKLNTLKKSILLIWGEEDITIPYSDNERIRGVLDCQFLSVPETRHIPHYERPELVNQKIIEFLKQK